MKIIRSVQAALCLAMVTIWGFLLFGFFAVPNEIVTVSDAVPTHRGMYSMEGFAQTRKKAKSVDEPENFEVTVKFLGTFPVKQTTMTVNQRRYVDVSGEVFGLRMYTSGVVIVSTDRVETPQGAVSPADQAGLKRGDILLEVNHRSVNSHTELSEQLSAYAGTPIPVVYERAGERRNTTFAPAYSVTKQRYMAGMWVRDSAAGIGTLTFYDPESLLFAGLGHAVCDLDTGEVLPLYNGDLVRCEITGCLKGSSGHAGELCGTFQSDPIGELYCNDAQGVYGRLYQRSAEKNRLPVALSSEVRTGKAELLATVNGNGPEYYDVEIEKLSPEDSQFRNMVIRVTDERLLGQTGGIVQGMSGSPIVQNRMLVGAVTHVFVNEPQRGYAIFGETMLQKMKIIAEAAEKQAS